MKAAGVSCPSHSNIIQPMCELGPRVPKNLIWSNYITTRYMAIEPNCMCFKASACKITSQPTGKATRMWNATAIPVCAHAARNKIKLAKPAHFMDDLKSQQPSFHHLRLPFDCDLTNSTCTCFFLRHAIHAQKGDKPWTFAARLRARKNRLSQECPAPWSQGACWALLASPHHDHQDIRVWPATAREHAPSTP